MEKNNCGKQLVVEHRAHRAMRCLEKQKANYCQHTTSFKKQAFVDNLNRTKMQKQIHLYLLHLAAQLLISSCFKNLCKTVLTA